MEILIDEFCTIQNVTIFIDCSEKIYSCTLNHTNIEKNNNKFYIIQILTNGVNEYYVYSRYGRVGEKGTIVPIVKFDTPYLATREFHKRFRTKTGNIWSGGSTIDFVPKPGKYIMMDTVIPDVEIIEEIKPVTLENSSEESSGEIISIKLEPQVNNVISLISSKKLMTDTIKKMDVDTSKLPLGKISKSQIEKAYSILKKIKLWVEVDKTNIIAAGILDPDKFIEKELIELSSSFWTLIPFSCGRNRPPIIQSSEQLKKYSELLEIMENIKIAGQIFRKTNNITDIYKELNVSINILNKETLEWSLIEKYIKNTHASTHSYKLNIVNIFKLDKPGHDENDKDDYFGSLTDHRLLIHGSRMANFMGVLTEGLRIPKQTQVLNGSVLGLGVYFADSISKSFNYCQSSETKNVGFVLLCEVALGCNPHIVTNATFDQRPALNYTSRIALGKIRPKDNGNEIININPEGGTEGGTETEGCNNNNVITIPCGELEESGINYGGFRYNEYVVYDSRQYRFRYLLQLSSEGFINYW
jgi:predicted DNA-binding WGR domain protein